MRYFLFALALVAVAGVAVNGDGCSTTIGGVAYNFGQLTKGGGTDYTAKDQSDYKYDFNICGTVVNPADSECANQGGMTCQYDPTGKQVAVVTKFGAGFGSPTFSAGAAAKSIDMKFKNGATCFLNNQPRTSTYTFVCDESATVGTISAANSQCDYTFTINTIYACPGHANDNGGPSGGLSGGWIFFILFIVGAVIYIAVGCFWEHRKAGLEGETGFKPRCPHVEFWKDLPGLVKDGCLFTIAGIKSLIAKCSGGSADSYETV